MSAVQAAARAGPKEKLPGRLAVASRTVAAILGGYLLAALGAMLMALVLPMPRAEAVSLATLLSFVTYALAAMWVFAARTATRAWLGLAGPIALVWILVHLLKGSAP